MIVLGSTGSIGRQTLQVIEAFPDKLKVVGLAAGANHRLLQEQVKRFRPEIVALGDSSATLQFSSSTSEYKPMIVSGSEGLNIVASYPNADIVVAAISGAAGFDPCMKAIEQGKVVALATKEVLVMAGELVTSVAERSGTSILPIDSEHNAVYRLLKGQVREHIEKVILTASGGPFAANPTLDFADVTPAQALAHPTWKMGPRITIDSATMMNKGFEIMEAHWLFSLSPAQIEVLVHPECLVHAMIKLSDGAILAHLAPPDMRLPITYTLAYPECWSGSYSINTMDLTASAGLHFFPVDYDRFPCLKLANHALKIGGSAGLILNAADEIAVQAFLQGRIKFSDIYQVVDRALNHFPIEKLVDVYHVVNLHRQVTDTMKSWRLT